MSDPKATYTAKSEIFLEGQPLNCSDIDVGPDGWVYFCVGGRNTAGSIFRIVRADRAGKPAPAVAGQGIGRAIDQPQLGSAWARRAVRDVKKELGDQWGPALLAVVVNASASPRDRVRALDLMQLYSPAAGGRVAGQVVAGCQCRRPRQGDLFVGCPCECRRQGSPDRARRRQRSGRTPAGLRGAGRDRASRRRSTNS